MNNTRLLKKLISLSAAGILAAAICSCGQKTEDAPTPSPAAVAIVIPTSTPAPSSMPTTVATEKAVASGELNQSHKEIVKALYSELVEKCNYYEKNYNEIEFGRFLADWNKRRDSAQSKLDNEKADLSLRISIGDLATLETEYKNKVMGKNYDAEFIAYTTSEIENAIR